MDALLRACLSDDLLYLSVVVFLQTTVVILVAMLLARSLGRWNPAFRYAICLSALALAILCPIVTVFTRHVGLSLLTVRTAEIHGAAAEASNSPAARSNFSDAEPLPMARQAAGELLNPNAENAPDGEVAISPALNVVAIAEQRIRISTLAILGWGLGASLLVIRWCHGIYRVWTLRKSSHSVAWSAIPRIRDAVREALGADSLPRFAVSNEVDRPVMIGLLHPLVVVPQELFNQRGRALADVLVHECAHSYCRHQAVGLVQFLAKVLYWPHPLIHFLNRQLATAREEVCDNFVLRGQNAAAYARTLLELSQSLPERAPRRFALGLFHNSWRLEDRIAGLLDRRRSTMVGTKQSTVVLCGCILLLPMLLVSGLRVAQSAPANEQDKPPSVQRRTVNRLVGDFPEKEDLSTPESALAAYHRASAQMNAERVLELSWRHSGPKEIQELEQFWERDPADIAVYNQAQLDAEILEVQLYHDDCANVVSKLAFPEGVGRHPYSSRSFGRIRGQWKNLGEDRLPSLEAAREKFEQNKELAWRRFCILRAEFETGGRPTAASIRGKPSDRSSPGESLGISAEKADLMGRVEWAFMQGARDITARKSLEWGEVEQAENGLRTIRYKYLATIWDKDVFVMNEVYAFDDHGNIVAVTKVEGYPQPKVDKPVDMTKQEGLKELVEDFFTKNFRDVTSRESLAWGTPIKADNGNVSVDYQYRAKIWDKDTLLMNQTFTFDPQGKFVSVKDVKGFPKKESTR